MDRPLAAVANDDGVLRPHAVGRGPQTQGRRPAGGDVELRQEDSGRPAGRSSPPKTEISQSSGVGEANRPFLDHTSASVN